MPGVEWKSRYTELLRVLKDQLKRKFREFAETVNEYILYVVDWKLWAKRLCVYASFLLAILLICIYLFNRFDLYHTDANNARYMLSAIVQAQAAIVAIVITLTLIAVQLTASTYSPRVIDVFKKNPDMRILLVVYAVSMLYGLFILKMMKVGGGGVVSPDIIWSFGYFSFSFEHFVSFAYWLEVFTLVALVLYMWNTIDLLKPEKIIKRLAIEITKDNILNSEEDPIQPIMDITHNSVMKYDLETVRVGLDVVTDQIVKIIDLHCENAISTSFCDHLERASRLAVSKVDEEAVVEVIKKLGYFGEFTAKNGRKDVTLEVVKSLRVVGKTAAESGLGFAAQQAARCLKNVGVSGIYSAEDGLANVVGQVAQSLGDVGKTAAENGLGDTTSQVAKYLEDIGIYSAEDGLENAASQAVWSLEHVGKTAAENRLDDAIWQVAESLGKVGATATKNEHRDVRIYVTSRVAESLGKVGKTAAENGLELATSRVIRHLRVVGVSAAEVGLGGAAKQAAKSLGVVGVSAAENELEAITSQVAEYLGEVRVSATENGLELATVVLATVADSLGEVGKTAVRNRLGGAASRVAQYLGEVGAYAIENGFRHITPQIIYPLLDIGISATEKELVGAALQVAKSLETVGKTATENELGDITSIVAEQLMEVGLSATENRLGFATILLVAQSLAKLTILSEEIVEVAIQESLKHEEPYHILYQDSFQKFMNLYESELKKMKTRKPD